LLQRSHVVRQPRVVAELAPHFCNPNRSALTCNITALFNQPFQSTSALLQVDTVLGVNNDEAAQGKHMYTEICFWTRVTQLSWLFFRKKLIATMWTMLITVIGFTAVSSHQQSACHGW